MVYCCVLFGYMDCDFAEFMVNMSSASVVAELLVIVSETYHGLSLLVINKCLANAKRPCDCRVLCLRLKSSLCSCAHSISDLTLFSCRDQSRDSVCPVL